MAELRDYWDATINAVTDWSLKSFRETLQYSEPGSYFPDADHIRKMNEERAITDEEIWESRAKWEAQQQADKAGIAQVGATAETITLYRVGPLPKEAKEVFDRSNVSDWLRDHWQESGGLGASGRWFTSDRKAAEWYTAEHPQYEVRSVEVDKSLADQWLAKDHGTARKFASEPEHEYFVPVDVANQAHVRSEKPMVEATRNEGFLDSVRRRAQEWIEDRPFLRQINRDLKEMAERQRVAALVAESQRNWNALPDADKADMDRRLDAYIASTEGQEAAAKLASSKLDPREQAEFAYMAEVDAMRASGRLYERDHGLDAAEARADVMGDASISGRMEFEDPAKSMEGVRQATRDAAGMPTEEHRAAESWRKDAGESYMAELANRSESNVDRRQMEMWATKQEKNRAAWDVASPVTHERQQEAQANTQTMKP